MIIKKGNLFTTQNEITLVTTNGTIKANGLLVMGRGAALVFKNKFPKDYIILSHLALKEGILEQSSDNQNYVKYSVVLNNNFGLFQVKDQWYNNANLDIIKESTDVLSSIAHRTPNKAFNMNFPGIGNGKLQKEKILPIIKTLPDNVIIWEL